jgi:hypothetical protein
MADPDVVAAAEDVGRLSFVDLEALDLPHGTLV